MMISFPIKGNADRKIGAIHVPLSVVSQDTPNMTVKIIAGSYFNNNNQLVEYPGGNSPMIVKPTNNNHWVIVGLNQYGSISITYSAAEPNPSIPTLEDGILPLAAIFVSYTTISITNSAIQDIRPFVRSNQYGNNIEQQLAQRPTITDVNNLLDTKADNIGTRSTIFTIGVDNFNPSEVKAIAVHKNQSPDPMIRYFNNQWELSNDGATFFKIATIPEMLELTVSNITDFDQGVQQALDQSTIAIDQVVDLPNQLQQKVSIPVFNSHAGNLDIHHTLPLPISAISQLSNQLDSKVGNSGGLINGNITVQNANCQPISLVSSDSGSSGLEVVRPQGQPIARFEWDQSSQSWLVGVQGDMHSVLSSAMAVRTVNNQTGDITITPNSIAAANAIHTHVASDITNLSSTISGSVNTAVSQIQFGQLSDTAITSPYQYQVITYNGSKWVNSDLTAGRTFWVRKGDGYSTPGNGSFNRPFTEIQQAIDVITPSMVGALIFVLPAGSGVTANYQPFTISNNLNLTIQGFGCVDSHIIRIDGQCTISGSSTTRIRLKDFSIWSTTTTEIPLVINGTQGRHYFNNISIERASGSTVDAISVTGSFSNWIDLDNCNVGGVIKLAGTPAANSSLTSKSANHSGMNVDIQHTNWTCKVLNAYRFGTITHSAGQVLLSNITEMQPTSGTSITSTAPAGSTNKLTLLNVNLYQPVQQTYGRIIKTGNCDYSIVNVIHGTNDTFTGTRLVNGIPLTETTVPYVPTNYTVSANSTIIDHLAAIDAKLAQI